MLIVESWFLSMLWLVFLVLVWNLPPSCAANLYPGPYEFLLLCMGPGLLRPPRVAIGIV